jgi:hypothetical protein
MKRRLLVSGLLALVVVVVACRARQEDLAVPLLLGPTPMPLSIPSAEVSGRLVYPKQGGFCIRAEHGAA